MNIFQVGQEPTGRAEAEHSTVQLKQCITITVFFRVEILSSVWVLTSGARVKPISRREKSLALASTIIWLDPAVRMKVYCSQAVSQGPLCAYTQRVQD